MSNRSPQQFRIELIKSALESISIPPGIFQKAQERYKSVTSFLEERGTLIASWRPELYVQGSSALGTAIRPLDKDDFDFDITCELSPPSSFSAMRVRKAVEERLRQDGNYSRMLNTEKNRCLCLDYAESEKFHLDIVVARVARWVNSTGTGIQVPDCSIENWIGSDPKGYLKWFKSKCDLVQSQPSHLAGRGEWMLILANADPPPEQPRPQHKRPLQWAVQIMKRHRDLLFEHSRTDDAPISVILTTLAAKAYQGEASLDDTLTGIAARLLAQFDDEEMWEVRNPCIPSENFSEKWRRKPQRRQAFLDWHEQFSLDVHAYVNSSRITTLGTSLESLVGSRAKTAAFSVHSQRLNEMQNTGQLAVHGGLATLTPAITRGSKPIPKHSNYGSIS